MKKRDERRDFEIELSDQEYEVLKNSSNFKQYFTKQIHNNIVTLHINYSIINNWDQIKIECENSDGPIHGIPGRLFSTDETRTVLKCLFSDVEINFPPNQITSVTSMNLDSKEFKSKKSTTNLASEVAQLLVDVQSQDALDLNNWVRVHKGVAPGDDQIDVRMRRFISAFNYMFPKKRYKTIRPVNSQHEIIFEENGQEMSISELSSGEKQIVFRGGFLLKDQKSSQGALVLIDEPEISLHPRWQMKILSYFKRLFSDETKQTSQIIVATHSPFVIHNSDRYNDKVIVLQKKDDGTVQIPEKPEFYGWTKRYMKLFHWKTYQFLIPQLYL